MVENGILSKTGLLSRRLYLEGGLEFDSGCGEDAAVTTLSRSICHIPLTRLAKVWSIRESKGEKDSNLGEYT
jgi:hypothetical protein